MEGKTVKIVKEKILIPQRWTKGFFGETVVIRKRIFHHKSLLEKCQFRKDEKMRKKSKGKRKQEKIELYIK